MISLRLIVLLNLFSLFFAANAGDFQALSLEKQFDTLTQQYLPGADVGIVVRDADTGALYFTHQAQQRFMLASNTKLFTAVSALYALGKNFKYETALFTAKKNFSRSLLKGDLIWTFSGDPTFTSEDLSDMVKRIKKEGIREIEGNIVLNTHTRLGPQYAEGVSIDDLGWYYTAPTTAIIIDENSEAYRLSAGKQIGDRIIVQATQEPHHLKIINRAKTVSTHEANNYCKIYLESENDNIVKILGCLPLGKKEDIEKLAYSNPFLVAKAKILLALKSNQIKLNGNIIESKKKEHFNEKTDRLIAKHQSKSLADLINHMLKHSDNIYANAITQTLGYTLHRQGSFQSGIKAIKTILREHTNIDIAHLSLSDGAGTSRYNLTTPFLISELLYISRHTPNLNKRLVDALPKPNQEGSLKWRFNQFDLKNQISAKTGTMHDTSSLCGYLTTNKGKHLVFAILINHVDKKIKTAKQFENQFIARVIQTL